MSRTGTGECPLFRRTAVVGNDMFKMRFSSSAVLLHWNNAAMTFMATHCLRPAFQSLFNTNRFPPCAFVNLTVLDKHRLPQLINWDREKSIRGANCCLPCM